MPQPYAQISAKKRCVWEVDEEHGCLIVDTLHKLINQIIGGQPQPTKAECSPKKKTSQLSNPNNFLDLPVLHLPVMDHTSHQSCHSSLLPYYR